MTIPRPILYRILSLALLAGVLWLAPLRGFAPAMAARGAAEAIDPESGKRADELGSESDEPRGPTGRTNLPLPRFASLRGPIVNARTGPGMRYPIDWVFQRRNLPVEITAEFENWRKIRDEQGTEGWVHRQMLAGKRSVIITGEIQTLRRQPDAGSPAVARLTPGVVAPVMECNGEWCRVEASGFRGWLRRGGTWGTKPGERVK